MSFSQFLLGVLIVCIISTVCGILAALIARISSKIIDSFYIFLKERNKNGE